MKNRDRVLLVDDEPHLLQALERGLRGRFAIETTDDPAHAIELVANNGPYAVLISDMRMPVVDGAALLSHALRVSPDTSRIMLTGNADSSTAARAVNEGGVFRFLNKPCALSQLSEVIETALEHHRRLRGERQLLEQTLQGAVGLLSDALELEFAESKGFGAARRLRDQARWIARQVGLPHAWEVEVAALMSQLGWISLPPQTREKDEFGHPLSEDERLLLRRAPATAARLVSSIPRLEGVASILGEVGAAPDTSGGDVRGSAIVGVLLQASELRRHGRSWREAMDTLGRDESVDRRVLRSLADWLESTPGSHQRSAAPLAVSFSELRTGMVTAAAIETADGRTLLGPGERIGPVYYERIGNHAKLGTLREPILIDGDAPAAESPGSPATGSAS